jgi:hypothetical protein
VQVADVIPLDRPGSGASRVVQGVFDVPEGVTGELANLIRDSGHSELQEYISGLRIGLEYGRIGVTAEKGMARGLKALKVFVRPTQQLPSTREGLTGHTDSNYGALTGELRCQLNYGVNYGASLLNALFFGLGPRFFGASVRGS